MTNLATIFLEIARQTPLENWRFCKVCMVRTEHQPWQSERANASGFQCLTCGDVHDLKPLEKAETK